MKIRHLSVWVWKIGLILLISVSKSFAQVGYVDISRADDTGDGATWGTAYKTLTNALVKIAGSSTTTLYVAQGTYNAFTNTTGLAVSNHTLQGGYPTSGGTRDWVAYATIIDGTNGVRAFNKNASGIFTLDGFIIQNCTNSGAGGAIYSQGALNLYNCVFTNNMNNNGNGGAIYCSAGALLVTNCQFILNRISANGNGASGAGVYSAAPTNTFLDCNFKANTNSGVNGGAGALCLGAGKHLLSGCTFSSNYCGWAAGGLDISGNVTASNCLFVGNRSNPGTWSGGGAVRLSGSVVTNTFVNCNFVSNFVTGSSRMCGGAVQVSSGDATRSNRAIFQSCLFTGNNSVGLNNRHGSAISQIITGNDSAFVGSRVECTDCVFSNNAGVAALYAVTNGVFVLTRCDFVGQSVGALNTLADTWATNCSFVANSNANGGAVYLGGIYSTNNFVNCTFFTNRATSGQGGALISTNANVNMTVTNCIFWGNRASGSGTNIQNAGTLTIGYSDINTNDGWVSGAGTVTDGGGVVNTNPLFGSTVLPYDVHLNSMYGRWQNGSWVYDAESSACIDAGLPYNAGDPASFFINEPTNNGGRINMGAYGNTVQASKSMPAGLNVFNFGATNIAVGVVGLSASLVTNGNPPDVYICWGTNDAGTNRYVWANVITNLAMTGTVITNNVSNLIYGIRYYYRCYATNDTGDSWALATTAFSPAQPVFPIVNSAATNITANAAYLNAILSCSGAVYDVYAYWGPTDGGINPAAWSTNEYIGSYTNLASPVILSKSVTGLGQATTNYYTFRASNILSSTNWVVPSMSYVTETTSMVNNADGATGVLSRTASLRCTVLNSQADTTIYYGTTDGGTDKGSWQKSINAGILLPGTYALYVGNLETNKLYYYRAYVTNGAGDNWAPASTNFTTTMETNFTPWDRKIPITFSGYTKSELLPDIPLLVTLSNNIDNSGFSYGDCYSTNGYDLRFSDESEANELPYEVEKWNTNGTSYLWVKVPVLSNQYSKIWMYYGRARQTNWGVTCTNGAVWANNYRAVWHLNNGELDSSQYKKNGSPFQVTNILGQIAGGKEFYNNGWVDVPEVALNMDKVTYSIWMKLPSNPDNLDAILNTDNWNLNDMQLMFNAGKVRLSVNGNSPVDTDSTYTFGAGDWNQWRYVTVVYDRIAKTSVFYVNAVPGTNNIYTTAVAGSITAANIGSYNISRYLNGLADEFSIADTARSSNWVWACYMNMASNESFVSCGTVSNVCPIIWSLPTQENVTTNSASLIAKLSGANADCIVVYDTNDWGTTLENWRFTNSHASVTAGTTITNGITNLLSNTYYYYMFYATNAPLGTNRYSEVSWFTTISVPVVDNAAATNINWVFAELQCNVITSHSANVVIYYGTNDGGTVAANWGFAANLGTISSAGIYSAGISNPIAGKTYYYRCYATNGAGDAWAPSTTNFNVMSPIYVDTNLVTGANNGTSWADAYRDIRLALTNAASTAVVWVAKGVYNFTNITGISSNRISLYGGFTNGAAWEERDWANNRAVLKLNATWTTGFRVYADDVTFNGMAFSNSGNTCVIQADGNRLNLENCIFSGGCLRFYGANTTVKGCSCYDMYGMDTWIGGAIYATKTVVLRDTLFERAISQRYGGAVMFDAADEYLTITNCMFRGGYAWYGGAVYVKNGMAQIYGCSFVTNVTEYGGSAIIFLNSAGLGNASIKNCAFAQNKSKNYAGAVTHERNSGGVSLTIENCSFYSNYVGISSLEGGAVMMNTSPLYVRNSIFWQNRGGVVNGNEISSSGMVQYAYSSFTGTNSEHIDIKGSVVESNNIIANPQFASAYDLHLKSSIGRWDPAVTNWVVDIYNSPCIDMGDPSYDYSNEPEDNGDMINMGADGNTVQASKSVTATIPTAEDSSNLVQFTSAIIRGKMTAGKKGKLTLFYGDNDGATNAGNWDHSYSIYTSEGQEVSSMITKLSPLTMYYYRTYVTNSAGCDWSDGTSLSFTTESAPAGASSNVIHVNPAATNAWFNDGSSWPNAYLTIQDGLNRLNNITNKMWVAKHPAGQYDINVEIDIVVSNITMYGGFNGTETDISQRDWTNNRVVLREGPNWAVSMQVSANDVTLNGLVFSNSHVDAFSIFSYGDRIKLENCSFYEGCPLRFYGSNTTVKGCSFYDMLGYDYLNSMGDNGGSIYATETVVLTDTLFERSRAFGNGGAIVFDSPGAYLIMTNCVFRSCVSDVDGGAVDVRNGIALINNCSFVSNVANHGGGAVYFENNTELGNAIIKNCAFAQNISTNYAGAVTHAMDDGGVSLTIENCSFYSNYVGISSVEGGAVMMNTSPLYVRNSIFWQNSGGMVNGNEISSSGIVDYAYSSFTGTNIAYIDIKGTVVESNNIIANPQFASAADLHLMSSTGRWDPAVTNWVVDIYDSPCIDMGDPSYDYSNEPEDNGDRLNMGAYGNTVQASKTTPETMPMVEDSSNSVQFTTAIIRGKMTAGKKGTLTLFYGDSDGYSMASNWDKSVSCLVSENQEFSLFLKNLEENRIYFYRTYATNSIGDDWSDASPGSLFFTTGSKPFGASSNVIHVNPAATNGWFNDGSSWPYACLTIQDGLNRMNNITNEMWMAKTNYGISAQISILTSNISLYGGFNGMETNRNERNWTNNITEFSGGANFYVTANDVSFDGLVFSNMPRPIVSYGERTKVQSCAFTGGLNLQFFASNALVANCIFTDIWQEWEPFCLYAVKSITIRDSVFGRSPQGLSMNWSCKGILFDGAGENLHVTNCSFIRGKTMYIAGVSLTPAGAGIYVKQGMAQIYGCSFVSNLADHGGSAVYFEDNPGVGPAVIRNSVFMWNSNLVYGGAIFHAADTNDISLIIENCSFYSNSVDNGSGGAINMLKAPLYLTNSILWRNSGNGQGREVNSSSGDVTVAYSCLTDTNSTYYYVPNGTNLSNVITNDPLFAGPYDLHLKSKYGRWQNGICVFDNGIISPCIDAGDPASPFSNEPYPNGGRINMGAYGNTPQASKNGKPSSLIIIR